MAAMGGAVTGGGRGLTDGRRRPRSYRRAAVAEVLQTDGGGRVLTDGRRRPISYTGPRSCNRAAEAEVL